MNPAATSTVAGSGRCSSWCRFPWLLVLLFNFGAACVQAQDIDAEYQLKAAFLFKFPLYVEWPAQTFADDNSPLVFGIMASEPMFNGLRQLAEGRTINGHVVTVVQLQPDAPLAMVHVLFIGRDLAGADVLLQQAVSGSVLTVTEAAPPVPADSMINFDVSDDRVRFDVALAPAKAAGLNLSARLLQVAGKVSDSR